MAALPSGRQGGNRAELERRLVINKTDYAAAFELYDVYRETGFWAEASALCDDVLAHAEAPQYWLFLKSEIDGERGRWDEAWKALATFAKLDGT